MDTNIRGDPLRGVESAQTAEAFDRFIIRDWPNAAGFQTLYEERDPIELEIHGTIPSYAAGTLLRTGPGTYKVSRELEEDYVCDHWFDGFGHTHCFNIVACDNAMVKVFYNSRRACDDLIKIRKDNTMYQTMTFGQKRDPCVGIFGKVMSSFNPNKPKTPSETNVNVTLQPNMPGLTPRNEFKMPDQKIETLWATNDSSQLKQLDPVNLEPIGLASQANLNPLLVGQLSCSHSMFDPRSGDMFNFNLYIGRTAIYRVFRTSAETGKTVILATIDGPSILPAYLHSFFMTEDYVILCIWGAQYEQNGAKMLIEQNILDAIAPFDPNIPAHWLVIDRKHGRGIVAEYESPAFFCFHTVNAWQVEKEDGNTDIICECVEYENMDILYKLYYRNIISGSKDAVTFNQEKGSTIYPQLSRYRLQNIGNKSLASDRSTQLSVAELVFTIPKLHIGDLPTINTVYIQRQNRYIYSIVNRGYSTFLDGIAKTDTKTKEVKFWDNEDGHTPGEAIFVADPEGKEEDDGVLLSVVLDGFIEKSYLLCLDARTMIEIGRAEVGAAVGFGFHGVHVGT